MADDRERKAAEAKFKKSERATEGHARAFSSSSSIWRIVVAVTRFTFPNPPPWNERREHLFCN
jgi:hypothetical protein